MVSGGRTLGFWTAALLVVASMVGTGVFTSTGFLIRDLGSPRAVLCVWAAGGLLALLGALCYAEIFSAYPENGGEYAVISKLYHPAAGFVTGAVTVVVGFCAPIAACALAFGEYVRVLGISISPRWTALGVILILTLLQMGGATLGVRLQNVLTGAKILFVAGLVAFGLWKGGEGGIHLAGEGPLLPVLISPSFGLGVVLVSYAYLGWNAASYVAGEVKNPGRNVFLSLASGTLLVTLLYLGLNLFYLGSAPLVLLSGKVEVAQAAAGAAFGPQGGSLVALIIAAGILSTIGAFIVTGARVLESLGRDYPALAFAVRNPAAPAPRAAILLQSALAMGMAAGAGFEALLIYTGFMLSAFAAFTGVGVFLIRRRGVAAAYRMPGYPVTPAIFVLFTAWTVGQAVYERPAIILSGAATVAAGIGLYFLIRPGAFGSASIPEPPE